MTLVQILLYVMIGTPQERQELRTRWKTFCEKHLIADDPYDDEDPPDDEREP